MSYCPYCSLHPTTRASRCHIIFAFISVFPPPLLYQDADLVVLDFAVNDGHVSPRWREKLGYSFAGGERRGFEQLVC